MNRLSVSTRHIAFVLALLFTASTQAQLLLPLGGLTIDFNDYRGQGFAPSPASDQLDSDHWATTGMTAGDSPFGSTATVNDFARGTTSGGVTTGGFYALERVPGTDFRFMVQSSNGDWTPGTVTLWLENNTGAPITDLDVTFSPSSVNNANRSNSLDFSWSLDDITYTTDAAAQYLSPGPIGGFDEPAPTTSTITGISVPTGGSIFLRWTGNDVTGGGARDELMLDDININPTTAAGSITTDAVGSAFYCISSITSAATTVDFSAFGTFTGSNAFTAQLSDAAGDFTSPINIGSLSLTGSDPTGTINVTIPTGTVDGTGYRIRVISNSPVITGTDNGTDLEVDEYPNEVSAFAATPLSEDEISLSWANPATCFDEVLIVMCTSASFSTIPSGDGSAYSTNSCGLGTTFDCGNVVYKGSGTSAVISELTVGTSYFFRAFTRRGTEWSNGADANGTTSAVLAPGDIMVIGVNANNDPGGSTAEDLISFVAFVDIAPGTSFDLTDNGWERTNPGQFGDTEGTIRITRTTSTIPAGTVFELSFRQAPTTYSGVTVGSGSDNNWTFTNLNVPGASSFNMNSGGDQIFLMQGGTWDNGGSLGDHNATYDGRILYGFNSRTTWAADGSTTQSNLHPSATCLSQEPSTGSSDYFAYSGPTSLASQYEWIDRLKDASNWTSYADNVAYLALNIIPDTLQIDPAGSTASWTGNINDNWYDCANWDNGLVPNATIDVVVPPFTLFDPTIDATATFADDFSNVARVKNLTLVGSSVLKIEGDRANTLEVFGDLANLGGTLDADDGIPGTEDGTIILHGDWSSPSETAFEQGESLVILDGSGTQTITVTTGPELFYDLEISKPVQELVVLNTSIEVGEDAGAADGSLDFSCGGIIQTGTNEVYVRNPATDAVLGAEAPNITDGVYENDRYIHGTLSWDVALVDTYVFPVGDAVAGEAYNPVSLERTGGATGKVSATFNTGIPGMLNSTTSGTGACAGLDIVYMDDMAGEGWWSFSGPAVTYNINLHHNAVNDILNPTLDNMYRALKAPSGTAGPGNNWGGLGAELDGDECAIGLWFNIPGEGYTGFSDFAPGGGGTALPVELVEFEVVANVDVADLSWITETEINSELFEIQRSADAYQWSSIGSTPAAGNSNERRLYQWRDLEPLNGLSYYRLKQIDIDGSYSFSEIKAVQFVAQGTADIYPNPTSGTVTLLLDMPSSGLVQYQLTDMAGRTLLANSLIADAGTLSKQLILNDLPAGTYLLSITTADYKVTRRVTKR